MQIVLHQSCNLPYRNVHMMNYYFYTRWFFCLDGIFESFNNNVILIIISGGNINSVVKLKVILFSLLSTYSWPSLGSDDLMIFNYHFHGHQHDHDRQVSSIS